MAVLKYRSTDGTIKTLGVNYDAGSGNAGVSSVNGKTGVVTGVYDVDNPPPYPVTKVDGKTGEVNTFSFIEGSSFPKAITKSGGITCFSYPLQDSSSLPKGNTAVYQVNFNGGVPIPVSASYIGNGYGIQCSVCRNTNTSFLISVTNNNELGAVDLTGAYICVTFYPNGATSVTGVSNA